MFYSVCICASTQKNSGRSTNGHLWLFLLSHPLRNYLTDSNETCLLCSPQCLVVKYKKKTIPVHRHIWPFGSRLGLSEISHWQACYRISSKTAGRIIFRSWSKCSPQCLVVQVPKQKSDLSKNMADVGHLWFLLLYWESGFKLDSYLLENE